MQIRVKTLCLCLSVSKDVLAFDFSADSGPLEILMVFLYLRFGVSFLSAAIFSLIYPKKLPDLSYFFLGS